uniref:Tetratricopeptide repeat protein 29 n=1 Tax=Gasterosteus aculeatus aculeatus TaxID=481459 RepID=G3Q418_GASAC
MATPKLAQQQQRWKRARCLSGEKREFDFRPMFSYSEKTITAMTRRKNRTEYSRMKQQQESLQTESVHILTQAETSRFRNSPKQNICVELLQGGYHRSFTEFFTLLDRDRVGRATPKPGLRTPLYRQRDKLETMLLHLRQAEQAENTCSWTAACDQRLLLGRYFSDPEDLWLSRHFYHRSADAERGGHSRPATEARARLAEIYLQLGELQQARQQAERCVRQADEGGWPLRLEARRTLWRVCSRLADAAQPAEALRLLHEGLRAAAESEDKRSESEASYRLGLTYQSAGDHDQAKKFFNSCIQISDELQDADWLGKSYKAMAASLESQGYTHEGLQLLEKLVVISRGSGREHALADSLMCLGHVYFKKSQYTTACEYFLQAHEVLSAVGDVSLLQESQVSLAMSRSRLSERETCHRPAPPAQPQGGKDNGVDPGHKRLFDG